MILTDPTVKMKIVMETVIVTVMMGVMVMAPLHHHQIDVAVESSSPPQYQALLQNQIRHNFKSLLSCAPSHSVFVTVTIFATLVTAAWRYCLCAYQPRDAQLL